MRRAGMVAVVVLAALALAGCASSPSSSAKTYTSTTALEAAYTHAGGKCADPIGVPASSIGTGANAILCTEGPTSLIVFDTAAQAKAYLQHVSSSAPTTVASGRWVVSGAGVAAYASSLGGTVTKH